MLSRAQCVAIVTQIWFTENLGIRSKYTPGSPKCIWWHETRHGPSFVSLSLSLSRSRSTKWTWNNLKEKNCHAIRKKSPYQWPWNTVLVWLMPPIFDNMRRRIMETVCSVLWMQQSAIFSGMTKIWMRMIRFRFNWTKWESAKTFSSSLTHSRTKLWNKAQVFSSLFDYMVIVHLLCASSRL